MPSMTPTVSMSDMFGTVPLSPCLYMRACVGVMGVMGVMGGMGVMWGFTRSGVSVSAPSLWVSVWVPNPPDKGVRSTAAFPSSNYQGIYRDH